MTKSMTPNQYAAEYEFRGDGGDYTPTDGERTMIEDAILGYLGQFDEPTSVKRPMTEIEFSPPYSYVPIPLDSDGQGPADEADAVSTTHEVWDANCFTVATCGSEETARKIAGLLNRSSHTSAERSVVGVTDEIERLTRELADLQAKAAKWDEKDGIDGAACSMIREKLDEFGAPRAAFIDDHVANGLLHARRQAFAEAAALAETTPIVNLIKTNATDVHAMWGVAAQAQRETIAAALRTKAEDGE